MKKRENHNTIDEQLKQELERLHALTDGIDEVIYVVDPDTYEILFANKKTKELFGEKTISKKCYEVFQNLNRPCPFCTNKHLFTEKQKTCTRGLQNHRNKRLYKCMDEAIEWPGNKYVRFGIAIDITEHKKIEDALRDSESRYSNLVENALEVIYILSADGTITSLNPAFEKLTGWSRQEWIGKSFENIIHPNDRPLALESFGKTLQGEEQKTPLELRVLSKSGDLLVGEFTSIPQIENGKIVGEFGIARDVTDRRRIEEALRDSEQLFHSVVDNSHESIIIVDDNFRIAYANDEATRLSGYSKEEIIGRDFRKVLDENEKVKLEDRYLRRRNGENVPPRYELKITTKNGERRDVEVKSTIIRDRHGKIRTIAQLLDITEQKKTENERKRFEESLSALNTYGRNLNTAESMEEIYRLTLDALEKTLGFKFADIFIVEGKMLGLRAHRGYSRTLSLNLPLDRKRNNR
jgi:PAS domain S-box-containing protein